MNVRQRLYAISTALLLTALIPPSLTAPAAAAEAPKTPPAAATPSTLAAERWREHSYGLSLLPPLGSHLFEISADQAVLRIVGSAGGGEYSIKVFIKKRKPAHFIRGSIPGRVQQTGNGDTTETGEADPKNLLTLDQIVQTAIQQVADSQPTAVLLDQKPLKPKTAPASVVYFKLKNMKQQPWVLGQAFMQMTPLATVMLQLDVDEAQYAQARPIFEAVCSSIEVQNPKELEEQRVAQVARGAEWRKGLGTTTLHAALVPEQWFRITEGDHDKGYMCVTQKSDKQGELTGIRIDVQTHIEMGQQVVDSLANFFQADNGESEIWSIRTTLRPLISKPAGGAAGKQNDPDATTWAETGVRDKLKITVTHEGPTEKKDSHWEVPPNSYVSQAELWMFDALLPHKKPTEMGFYAYTPNAGRVSFRTERVVVQSDGTVLVYSRPILEQPEQVSYFKATGGLIKRMLPSGQVVFPATRQELAARWSLKPR
ncbi:MAG: hypothetical protein K8S99_01290 [Planctomycetes bacterium]|nr:hypothetical protein [Planctomycetota bacterium]